MFSVSVLKAFQDAITWGMSFGLSLLMKSRSRYLTIPKEKTCKISTGVSKHPSKPVKEGQMGQVVMMHKVESIRMLTFEPQKWVE